MIFANNTWTMATVIRVQWFSSLIRQVRSSALTRPLCTQQLQVGPDDARVQELLLRMTGMDFDRVFAPHREPLKVPQYKLMSLSELQTAHESTKTRAAEMLQMPPVLAERRPRGEVIRTDHCLSQYSQHKIIFTDTTQHKQNTERDIVVRETDGTLRDATWEERDRMCQLFFPVVGRKMTLPAMLTEEGIMTALKSHHHINILDRVGLQCEPDSADYIRVHHTVYGHIEQHNLYDLLRSTRYFGCLVWYLVQQETVAGVMSDMLKRNLFSDCVDLVSLYCLVHPVKKFTITETDTDLSKLKLVQDFAKRLGMRGLLALVMRIVEQGSTTLESDSQSQTASNS